MRYLCLEQNPDTSLPKPQLHMKIKKKPNKQATKKPKQNKKGSKLSFMNSGDAGFQFKKKY